MPVWRHSLTNRSTCLEGGGEQNRKIGSERGGGILFIEFDAEHEKRDGISKSLLLRYRRPHLESRVIVTFNLFTIAGSSTWPEELSTFRVTCLFISCDRIFFEQFRTG